MKNAIKLGEAIAYLEYKGMIGFLETTEKPRTKALNTLKHMMDTYQRLKSEDENKFFKGLPGQSCNSSKAYLENNDEFFIYYILLFDRLESKKNLITRIITHLNDCFWCFEIYSQVMQDYYNTSQKLLGTHNGDLNFDKLLVKNSSTLELP